MNSMNDELEYHRDKHNHKAPRGGLELVAKLGLTYCVYCDQYVYPDKYTQTSERTKNEYLNDLSKRYLGR